MKVALVHDYLKEYGGAERVLRTLADIFPQAPIYTAFRVKGSTADREFRDREIKESQLAPILKIDRFYSPLRFLIPVIWGRFNLSAYDLVITSSSWYVTRGFKISPKTKVVCYCHTPPRWLYGYQTSVGFTKYWPVRVYATLVGHFIRLYDFAAAQPIKREGLKPESKIKGGVDLFLANSENVRLRIKKFYRREAKVIYPPVEVKRIIEFTRDLEKKDYFLVVSRLVGAKGLEEVAEAAKKIGFKLKIVGEANGFAEVKKKLERLAGGNVTLLGRVNDETLYRLYGEARGFIALARDEDFGITVVEAQAAGTPVIAFAGGGFKESIIDGKTGILVDNTDEKAIATAVKKLEATDWDKEALRKNALRFSKEKFVSKIKEIVGQI